MTIAPARRWPLALLGLALSVLLVRSAYFGDPVIDADEQFYLLVGDRWMHGVVPYVDIWDRKPIGLFALFAGIRLLGGDGILQYQLVAAAFVVATTLIIATIARRLAGPVPAIIVALAYPLMLGWSGGMGGQSPVFYNLPMALAALLVLRQWNDRVSQIGRNGAAAMLLVGLALQIKYAAVFEGAYFGVALLWIAGRRGLHPLRITLLATAWIVTALLPTAIAFAAYSSAGHGADWLFANVTSILLRHNDPPAAQARALGKMILRLLPELIVLTVAIRWRAKSAMADIVAYRFVLGWTAIAAIGILAFGNYFNHYALPLMVPLSIAIAPALIHRNAWLTCALAATIFVTNGIAYIVTWRHILARSGDRAYATDIAAIIRRNLNGGSLYVFNGEPILYYLTDSPLPTRWPFPYHLSFAREAGALGVPPIAEIRAIMAQDPVVIVDTSGPPDSDLNQEAQRFIRDRLRRHYCLAASYRLMSDRRNVFVKCLVKPPARY